MDDLPDDEPGDGLAGSGRKRDRLARLLSVITPSSTPGVAETKGSRWPTSRG